jgi:hypothetical protein
MVFLTPQEFDLVLGHVRDEYAPLIRLLAGTGLRYGEATALTVRDLELLGARKALTVSKAWKRTGSASWALGDPKTRRSRRTLSLSTELVDLLIPLVAGRRGSDLLFPGSDGGRLPHIEVYKRAWAPAVARARVCDAHYEPQRNKRNQPPRLPAPCDCAGVLETHRAFTTCGTPTRHGSSPRGPARGDLPPARALLDHHHRRPLRAHRPVARRPDQPGGRPGARTAGVSRTGSPARQLQRPR